MALGPLDADGLADFKTRNVLGDVAGGVGLYQEGKLALVVVGGYGRVGAHDLLTINAGGNRDMLTNREAEDVIGSGEVETIAVGLLLLIGLWEEGEEEGFVHSDVVGNDSGLGELKILEQIGFKDCPRLCKEKLPAVFNGAVAKKKGGGCNPRPRKTLKPPRIAATATAWGT